MRGHKIFEPDWTCRGYKYEVGKTYEIEGDLEICKNGFHFCRNLIDCFSYYKFNHKNKVAIIIYQEKKTIHAENKSATSKIKILKELSWEQVLKLLNTGKYNTGKCNTGDYNSGHSNSGNSNSGNCNYGYSNSGNYNSGNYNSGYSNSGHSNSGYYNSGYFNSGHCNSGYYNSGNHNSGNYNSGYFNSGKFNSGFFNSDEAKIRMFNKETNLYRKDIDLSFLDGMKLTKFIPDDKMPEKGYLEKYTYFEMWENWYSKQDKEVVNKKIKELPNFDEKIFKEITGLTLSCPCD